MVYLYKCICTCRLHHSCHCITLCITLYHRITASLSVSPYHVSCNVSWSWRVQTSMSSMKDALFFGEGLGHNANGRSLLMTPEFERVLHEYIIAPPPTRVEAVYGGASLTRRTTAHDTPPPSAREMRLRNKTTTENVEWRLVLDSRTSSSGLDGPG